MGIAGHIVLWDLMEALDACSNVLETDWTQTTNGWCWINQIYSSVNSSRTRASGFSVGWSKSCDYFRTCNRNHSIYFLLVCLGNCFIRISTYLTLHKFLNALHAWIFRVYMCICACKHIRTYLYSTSTCKRVGLSNVVFYVGSFRCLAVQ